MFKSFLWYFIYTFFCVIMSIFCILFYRYFPYELSIFIVSGEIFVCNTKQFMIKYPVCDKGFLFLLHLFSVFIGRSQKNWNKICLNIKIMTYKHIPNFIFSKKNLSYYPQMMLWKLDTGIHVAMCFVIHFPM